MRFREGENKADRKNQIYPIWTYGRNFQNHFHFATVNSKNWSNNFGHQQLQHQITWPLTHNKSATFYHSTEIFKHMERTDDKEVILRFEKLSAVQKLLH